MKALLRDLLAFTPMRSGLTKHELKVEGQIPLPSEAEEFEEGAREQFRSLQKIGLSIPVFTV